MGLRVSRSRGWLLSVSLSLPVLYASVPIWLFALRSLVSPQLLQQRRQCIKCWLLLLLL